MKQILVAEDELNIAGFMRAILKQAGYLVDVVHTGGDALLFVQERSPDLLILDVGLPGMSGNEVLRTLKEKGCTSMPIIVATADFNLRQYLRLGATYVIDKPYDIDTLLSTVHRCFQEGVGSGPSHLNSLS